MKAPSSRERKAGRALCMDCAGLETRIDLDGRSNYWCALRAEHLSGPIIWKKACGRFVSEVRKSA